METSIIKSLFRWFADCDVLEVDNDLNVDYLGEDPEQYSIEVVPCKTVLKQYIDGSAKCQYLFIFASRENYSPDESINMANLEFYERLQEWIAEQDLNGKLPKLPEGLTLYPLRCCHRGMQSTMTQKQHDIKYSASLNILKLEVTNNE